MLSGNAELVWENATSYAGRDVKELVDRMQRAMRGGGEGCVSS